MKKTLFLIVAIAIIFTSCHSKKQMVSKTNSNEATNTSPNKYAEGQSLYAKNCVACHGLKNPANYTTDNWYEILPKMVNMANKKAQNEIVSTADQHKMLDYVLSVCKK